MCVGIPKYRGIDMRLLRVRLRAGMALPLMAAAAITAGIALRSPDSRAAVIPPTYSIDFHAIGAGGNVLRNTCFGLSGTVGQPAPGYSRTSDGITYSIYAGFWSATPATGLDEIFFTGFEEC
jgi:hypothetical protein